MAGEDPPFGCHIPWPYPFPTHPSPFQPPAWHPDAVWIAPVNGYGWQPPYQPTDHAPPLSDSDVDRIARRIVELLREAKP